MNVDVSSQIVINCSLEKVSTYAGESRQGARVVREHPVGRVENAATTTYRLPDRFRSTFSPAAVGVPRPVQNVHGGVIKSHVAIDVSCARSRMKPERLDHTAIFSRL